MKSRKDRDSKDKGLREEGHFKRKLCEGRKGKQYLLPNLPGADKGKRKKRNQLPVQAKEEREKNLRRR